MAVKIIVSANARANFNSIASFLKEHWSDKIADSFAETVEISLLRISSNPYIGKIDDRSKKIRILVVLKQLKIVYSLRKEHILILSFFDTRQDPNRRKLE